MARHLTETALTLITDLIKKEIGGALQKIRTIRPDNTVTTEIPPTESYFNYPEAHGYRCPAIFVIDKPNVGMDFRQGEIGANHINALLNIDVSVKVEDRLKRLLVLKALRYQAALHQILDQTPLASSDGKVKLYSRVKRIVPSGLYTYTEDEKDTKAVFYFEYRLELEVDFFENF